MPFDITFLSLFCVCLLVIALEALNLRKLARKIRIQGHTLTELRQELEALLLCDRGMGDRIKQQQKQVRCMIERQDNLEISNSSNTSYKQAMVLLRKGASTDEVRSRRSSFSISEFTIAASILVLLVYAAASSLSNILSIFSFNICAVNGLTM